MASNFDYIDYLVGNQDLALQNFSKLIFSKGIQPTLVMGVVVETLNNPGALTSQRRDILYQDCTNKSYFYSAPRNSAIVRIISNSDDRAGATPMVAYPFFPPHLCLPIKPGETVWLIDPAPQEDSDLLFWMCRVQAPNFVDDINFTHYDRSLLEIGGNEEGKKITDDVELDQPAFPNGLNTESTRTLSLPNNYEAIFTGSYGNQSVTFEPVPRFTKRPGDLVLQGSNNAIICLGEDRGNIYTEEEITSGPTIASNFPKDPSKQTFDRIKDGVNLSNVDYMPGKNEPAGNWNPGYEERSSQYRGTIDIVAGRGQHDAAKPELIKNSREYFETNKNLMNYPPPGENAHSNWYLNPLEGDPHFVHDLSRVYVSMKTSGDKNFGLQFPKSVASNAVDFAPFPDDHPMSVPQSPYVATKSNEIRLIARGYPETEAAGQGSIRIIKEGLLDDDQDGTGQASIMLEKDGTVIIDGPKIVIGSGIQYGNGEGRQVAIGLNATEPIVLGNKMNAQIDNINNALDRLAVIVGDLANWCSGHKHPTGVGPTGEPITAAQVLDVQTTSIMDFMSGGGDAAGVQTIIDAKPSILSTVAKTL